MLSNGNRWNTRLQGAMALRTLREARTCVRFVAALSIAMLFCYLGPTYLIGQCSSPYLVRLTSQKIHDELHLSGDRVVSWQRQLCTRETLLNDSQVSGGHASVHVSGRTSVADKRVPIACIHSGCNCVKRR